MAFVIVLLVIAVVLLLSCIKIVPQAHAYVIERLGAFQDTWSVGLHIKMPIIDRVARRVDLKEQVVDFAPQPVITKDNVTMRIDTVVFYQITDPKLLRTLQQLHFVTSSVRWNLTRLLQAVRLLIPR